MLGPLRPPSAAMAMVMTMPMVSAVTFVTP